MKKIVSFICLILCIALVAPTFVSTIESEAETTTTGTTGREKVEVVILMDVSGSMNTSDPEKSNSRVSLDSALAFAWNAPVDFKNTDLHMSLVAYSTEVKTVARSLNMNSASDKATYEQRLVDIGKKNVSGVNCYDSGGTNIGGALNEAASILKDSDAQTKAVILFTDGELWMPTDAETEASQQLVTQAKNTILDKDILLYCIGLNGSNGVNFDGAYLDELANGTGGKSYECNTSDAALTAFQDVYADIFEIKPDKGEDHEVDPIVYSDHEVVIYGEIVMEANINILADVPLSAVKVTDPNGNVLEEIDYTNDTDKTNNENIEINISESKLLANVKMLKPADGVWKISIKGEQEGTAIARDMLLYDLAVQTDFPDKICLGDKINATAWIYNVERKAKVNTTSVYADNKLAVKFDDGSNRIEMISANDSHNSYEFDDTLFGALLNTPGKYDITFVVEKTGEFSVETKKTIEVLAPVVSVKVDKTEAASGDKVKVELSVVKPTDNSVFTTMPVGMDNLKSTVTVKKGEAVIKTEELTASSFTNGVASLEVVPDGVGDYTIAVDSSCSGFDIAGATASFKVAASVITVSGDKSEIGGYITATEEKYDLSKIFADSDGDKLTYEVETSGDGKIDAEIDGDELIVKVDGAANGNVKVTATDGDGAVATYEIKIATKSIITLIIIIAVIVVVLIVLAIIILLFIKARKKIRIAFNVRIDRYNDGMSQSVVQQIKKSSTVKNSKSEVSLFEILTDRYLINVDEQTPEWFDTNFKTFCAPNFKLTGLVFKNGFKVTYGVGKNVKTKTFISRDISFTATTVNPDGTENTYTVMFGGKNSFLDTMF